MHRPRASVLGQDAYPDLLTKAAALMQSLARNHPLVDGNKRLAWLATYVFCAKNGVELDPGDDEAYDLVIAVATGADRRRHRDRRPARRIHGRHRGLIRCGPDVAAQRRGLGPDLAPRAGARGDRLRVTSSSSS